MDFRNKWLLGSIRSLIGLVMLASGIFGLLYVNSFEGLPAQFIPILEAFAASGIIYMIRITEILVGAMLLFNFFPALGALFMAPLSVGIIVFDSFLAPEFLPVAFVIALINAYLGYAYWDKYQPLFER